MCKNTHKNHYCDKVFQLFAIFFFVKVYGKNIMNMKEIKMKVKPLFDRIAISVEQEEKSQSGIFLGKNEPDGIKVGTVVFVSPFDENSDGKKLVLQVEQGDRVLFNKYSGVEAVVDKKPLVFIRQTDILAILED